MDAVRWATTRSSSITARRATASYLTRYLLPDNGVPWDGNRRAGLLRVPGRGRAVHLAGRHDVIYQDGAAFVGVPAPLTPAASTGNAPIPAGTSFYIRGYSGGAQTRWLRRTLATARRDDSIDWIIVQMHQDVASSSVTGNGSGRRAPGDMAAAVR